MNVMSRRSLKTHSHHFRVKILSIGKTLTVKVWSGFIIVDFRMEELQFATLI